MEDSWDRTPGFLLYTEAHVTRTEVQNNSPNYSFVWNGERWANDFRSTNPRSNLGYYVFAFLDDQDGRPDPLLPGEDGPESRLRTLLWWMLEADGIGHPDWILYQCDGVTPAYESLNPPASLPNMPLDITNPAVIDWQAQSAEMAQSSITALTADIYTPLNLNHACGVYRNGQWVQLFSGEDYDPVYEAAVFNWARQVRARLAAQRYPKGLIVNCPPIPGYDDEEVSELAASVDGILDEEGFTYYGRGRENISWLVKVRRMIEIQNQGVAYYSVNYVDQYPPTQEQVNWILGSYLMAREHSAYIAILEETIGNYGNPPWPHLPEYDIDVGHPCAAMTASQGVYARDFSNGMVVVNPSNSVSYAFALPEGNFSDLYGTPVENEILLEPLSGKVLVSSEPRCL